ncbi:MAG: hypothetical protein LBU61_01420 [Coriobacteriales bacterium]|nr:hypothetical protein [Coriobacteriales bacterium]
MKNTRIAAAVLYCLLTLSSGILIACSDDNQYNSSVDETTLREIPALSNSDGYLATFSDGSLIIAAYRASDGGLVQISKQEFSVIIEEMEMQSNQMLATIASPEAVPKWSGREAGVNSRGTLLTTYSQLGFNTTYHNITLLTRVSTYVKNETPNIATLSFSCSINQGATANITLSADDKRIIQLTTGYSYSVSYAFDPTASVSGEIAPGETGWIEFYPIMYCSFGYLNDYWFTDTPPYNQLNSQRYVEVCYPMKTETGYLDGVYLIRQSSGE